MGPTAVPPSGRFPMIPGGAVLIAGMLAVLLTVGGCFFFRSKPNAQAQELTDRLSPGLTMDEVVKLVGPPQRRGQNLFDTKKEYWIYEFVSDHTNKKKRARDAERDGREGVPDAEVLLLFERGKLVNWNYAPLSKD